MGLLPNDDDNCARGSAMDGRWAWDGRVSYFWGMFYESWGLNLAAVSEMFSKFRVKVCGSLGAVQYSQQQSL